MKTLLDQLGTLLLCRFPPPQDVRTDYDSEALDILFYDDIVPWVGVSET
ncbi:hypothetical protein ACNKHO_06625 [Shigella flexneri]